MARQRRTLIQAFRGVPQWYREGMLIVNRRFQKADGYKVIIPMTKKFF